MSYRVTNNMMNNLLLNDMHANLSKLLDIQQQLSTQRKYQFASQNPNAVTKGMGLETMLVESEQYKDNLDDAVSWLKFSDAAMGEMNDIFHRVRELAIYAGDGALEGVDLDAIATELSEIKSQLVSLANSTIAGEYLFAGLLTRTTPFTVGDNGEVVYNGNEHSVKWEFSRKDVGKVSITGNELFPKAETSNSLIGIDVPMDFEWKGRNEILEFKVGWQTVKVRIPEKWKDETVNGLDDYGDYNRYRDFGELEGWSLQEIADMINSSTEMGDVSKILRATVISDPERDTQRLVIKSHTGETVRLTSWPETDPVWLSQGIKGAAYGPKDREADAAGLLTVSFNDGLRYDVEIDPGDDLATIAGKLNGLPDGRLWAAVKKDDDMGNQWLDLVFRTQGEDIYFNIEATGGAIPLFTPQMASASSHVTNDSQVLSSNKFKPDEFTTYTSGDMSIVVDGTLYWTGPIKAGSTLDDIVKAINGDGGTDPGAQHFDEFGNAAGKLADVGVEASIVDGRLVLKRAGEPKGTFDVFATGGLAPLLSDGAYALSSTTADSAGKYTLNTAAVSKDLKLTGESGALYLEIDGERRVVPVEKDDTLAAVTTKLNGLNITGLTAELVDDVNEAGDVTQFIRIKADSEVKLTGFGSGASVVGSYFTGSKEIKANTDHTHIGLAEYLGLETSIKSTELRGDGLIGNTDPNDGGSPLHIKFVSGANKGEVYIADDKDLTIDELASRINGVCGTWLQAVVEIDEPDGTTPWFDPLTNSENNREDATKRLVLRTLDGEPFAVYDGAGMTAAVAGSYAERLGISTALMGQSTAAAPANTQDWNVKYPERSTADADGPSFFDENMPALIQVKVGTKLFECKVCNNNCPTAEKVAAAIVRQVNEQYGGTLLAWDENDVPNVGNTSTFALFATTGEPLQVTDLGYGDPRYTEFSGGVAMQLGISSGVTSVASDVITDETRDFGPGTIRLQTAGHSVDVPVLADDTLKTLAGRIREYAGEWLNVSFHDTTIGPTADGGLVRMGLSAKDGSPISIVDIGYEGDAATAGKNNTAHRLGLDTGLTGTKDLSGGVGGNFPTFKEGDTLTIEVNGAVHTIDMWDNEIDRPVAESIEDMAEEINSRFQGKDIVADVYENNGEKYLIVSSPYGYTFNFTSTGDIAEKLGFGTDNSASRGFAPADVTSLGDKTGANYNQNVVRRTGNDQKRVDVFGVIDNLIDCVRGGHVDGISDTMIGQLDNWLNTLLKCRAQAGALQSRYQTASYTMTSNHTNYTDLHLKTVGVDLAEAITDYQMASNVYEASLAAIARIMQPTLLDFLS